MTNLEFKICEACNAGEIDIETRDKMISVLESTDNKDTQTDGEVKPQDNETNKELLQESVEELKMEIYESELSGKISSEERELLIGYMEAKAEINE